MDRLPSELWIAIGEQCENRSLKMLRLVNRKYCDAVTPRLFEHFYMAVSDEYLDTLVSISESRLAKHIKHVTVYLDRLPNWQREEWEQAINYHSDIAYWKAAGQSGYPDQQAEGAPDGLPFNIPSNPHDFWSYELFSSEQLDRGWKEFSEKKLQQASWRESNEGVILKECLAMLLNLNSITCTPAYVTRMKDFQSTWPVWNSLRRKILIAPIDLGGGYIRIHSGHQDHSREYYNFARRVIFIMLEAIAYRASFSGIGSITNLNIHNRSLQSQELVLSQGYNPVTHDCPEFRRRVPRMLDGFGSLTHINWCISATPQSEEDLSRLAMESVLFLQGSKHLRSLDLSYYDSTYNPQALRSTFGDATIDEILNTKPSWRDLHYLRLSFRATHTKLLALFHF